MVVWARCHLSPTSGHRGAPTSGQNVGCYSLALMMEISPPHCQMWGLNSKLQCKQTCLVKVPDELSSPSGIGALSCSPTFLTILAFHLNAGEEEGRPLGLWGSGWKCSSQAVGPVGHHGERSALCPLPPAPCLSQGPFHATQACLPPAYLKSLRTKALSSVIRPGLLFFLVLHYNFLWPLGSHTQFPRGLCTLYWKLTSQHHFCGFFFFFF